LEWLSHVGYNTVKTAPPFIRKVNALVDNDVIRPEDTLFLIGEGKGYLLECPYVPDSSRAGIPWLVELMRSDFDYARTAASLKARNIRWIAVNTAFFEGVTKSYPVSRKPLVFSLYHFLQFIDGHAQVHGFESGFIFAEIR